MCSDKVAPPEMPIVIDPRALKDILGPPLFEMEVSRKPAERGSLVGQIEQQRINSVHNDIATSQWQLRNIKAACEISHSSTTAVAHKVKVVENTVVECKGLLRYHHNVQCNVEYDIVFLPVGVYSFSHVFPSYPVFSTPLPYISFTLPPAFSFHFSLSPSVSPGHVGLLYYIHSCLFEDYKPSFKSLCPLIIPPNSAL